MDSQPTQSADEMKRHEWGLAGRDQFENDHSVVAAGAVDDAQSVPVRSAPVRPRWGVRFGVGGFLAAAGAGVAAAVVAGEDAAPARVEPARRRRRTTRRRCRVPGP